MRQIYTVDRNSYPITSREYTETGFLKVPGRVAKVGIQEYLAGELNLPGDPNRIVRVMRVADEVFKPESLATYDGADVTLEHPPEFVGAENFKKYSVGVVMGGGRQDGDFVVSDLCIKDAEAIKAAEQGKVQLSAGYTCAYDDQVPEGADYEFIQRNIAVNHVALVDNARAGAQARIFDNRRGVKMSRVTLDSGRTVEVADESVAALISDTIERLNKRIKDAEEEIEKKDEEMERLEEEKEAANAAKDKAEEEAKKDKMSDEEKEEKISSLVKEIISVASEAETVAGERIECDSMKPVEIMKAALKIARPTVDWDKKSDAYVTSAFDLQKESAISGQYSQVAKDGAAGSKPAVDARTKAVDGMVNAYKKTTGEVKS